MVGKGCAKQDCVCTVGLCMYGLLWEYIEAVLAVGLDGVAKHWILSSRSEMKEMGGCIVEEKSQTLDLSSPPLSLASYCYQGMHCTVLLVCKEAWQVGVFSTCTCKYVCHYVAV